MVSWDFGSRLVERLDMTYVSFGQRFGGKGDVPHYFHDTHATPSDYVSMIITDYSMVSAGI